MADRTLALSLAKLTIALAWADGEVHPGEVNTVKHLLIGHPDITHADWRELELYLDHPVDEAEFDMLLANVMDRVATGSERDQVLTTLTQLVTADGVVSIEEEERLAAVREALDEQGANAVSAVGAFVGASLRRISSRPPAAVREHRLDDYMHNPVFFRISRTAEVDLDDHELRRTSLAAGLMATVARTSGRGANALVAALVDDWSTEQGVAEAMAEAALDQVARIDPFRLGKRAVDLLDREERRTLMAAPLKLASDGLSADAEFALRRVGGGLALSHKELMNAKEAGRS